MDQRMRTDAAARYVGLSVGTMVRMRSRGDGPAYAKAGPRIVVYSKGDLDDWLNRRTRRSEEDKSRGAELRTAPIDA